MIGLLEHALIDRRSPISGCRPARASTHPEHCDAADVVPSPVVLVRSDRESVYPHDQRGAFRRQATGQRLSQLARQLLFHPGRRRVARVGAQGRNVDPDKQPTAEARLRLRGPAPTVTSPQTAPHATIEARRVNVRPDMIRSPIARRARRARSPRPALMIRRSLGQSFAGGRHKERTARCRAVLCSSAINPLRSRI